MGGSRLGVKRELAAIHHRKLIMLCLEMLHRTSYLRVLVKTVMRPDSTRAGGFLDYLSKKMSAPCSWFLN